MKMMLRLRMGLSTWKILFQNIPRKLETLLKEHSVEKRVVGQTMLLIRRPICSSGK
jgi:hypothetical protein